MAGETFLDDVCVIEAGGSNQRLLTDTPDAEQNIAWSPARDYVLIVHSKVLAGTEYGYVEQAFYVRIGR